MNFINNILQKQSKKNYLKPSESRGLCKNERTTKQVT